MSAFKDFYKDNLYVRSFADRKEMGKIAAKEAAEILCKLIRELPYGNFVRVVFAAAPSQNEFLEALCQEPDIAWDKVEAFHMDEYIGLPIDAPSSFGNFLRRHIFDKLPFARVNYLSPLDDPLTECNRYASLLSEAPIDIVFMGIGENGHIAFNDPPVADFEDINIVKIVPLDEICRHQQVNDGCFESIEEVPTHALTLTIPALMSAKYHFCIVPAKSKATAVYNCINGDISTACPATILRKAKNARLYLDKDSSYKLWE